MIVINQGTVRCELYMELVNLRLFARVSPSLSPHNSATNPCPSMVYNKSASSGFARVTTSKSISVKFEEI